MWAVNAPVSSSCGTHDCIDATVGAPLAPALQHRSYGYPSSCTSLKNVTLLVLFYSPSKAGNEQDVLHPGHKHPGHKPPGPEQDMLHSARYVSLSKICFTQICFTQDMLHSAHDRRLISGGHVSDGTVGCTRACIVVAVCPKKERMEWTARDCSFPTRSWAQG